MWQFLFMLSVVLAVTTISSAAPGQRLVNADVATYGQFPWMVSLRVTSSSSHTCGGALVTPEHVITAAHCVVSGYPPTPYPPGIIFVVTGQLSNLSGGRVSALAEIRMHPGYDPFPAYENDIAVLKLLTAIPYTATERPIPIASADVGAQPCVLSGWGLTLYPGNNLPSQLQTHIFNTMTREICIEIWPAEFIFESTLCVGGVQGNGVCSGDSGGPLVCNGELAGVVSWANLCANGMPDGFARVFFFREWLLENTADLSPLGKIYATASKEIPTLSP